jgi:hypothetical protein
MPAAFEEALVRSHDRDALLRALAGMVSVLLREGADAVRAAARIETELHELLQEG